MEIVVVALGGNALSRTGEEDFREQFECAERAAHEIASLAKEFSLVLTHGNGPQVGNLLLRVEKAKKFVRPSPLDACVADTQGEIGYILQHSMRNEFEKMEMRKEVATVVTRVLVDADDEAFSNPTKPIGPFYQEWQAKSFESQGWVMARDPRGRGFRRVVASPKPIEILEHASIRIMVEAGIVTIACGGGGIPVARRDGKLVGVEAVIDKDLASSLLAREIGASKLIILTDVDAAYANFGKPNQKRLEKISPTEALGLIRKNEFSKGSMEPKVMAAAEFAMKGGEALITSPEKLKDALAGKAGTTIRK
ncbi:MAG: carbamate kinase [Candidatus Micrarchaeota archaeon]|nr:carbamate kinase [Candidatus Micrarchaeota archaeon]